MTVNILGDALVCRDTQFGDPCLKQSIKISVITPGERRCKFTFTVPKQIPSSTEEEKGNIRYTARLILERPWKFDLKYSLKLTVIRDIDLNTEMQELRSPIQREVSKTMFNLFHNYQPITMKVLLPTTGFVANQTINITVIIINPTGYEIDHVEIKFMKRVCYLSKLPRARTLTKLITIRADKFGDSISNGTKHYKIRYKIPAVPTSNLNLCQSLNVSYHMVFKGELVGIYSSPTIKIPVVIGRVGFRDNTNNSYTLPSTVIPSSNDEPLDGTRKLIV